MPKEGLKFAIAAVLALLFAAPLLGLALKAQDRRPVAPLRSPVRIASQALVIDHWVHVAYPEVRDVQTLRVETPHETAIVAVFEAHRAKFVLLSDGSIVPDDEEAREILGRAGRRIP